MVSKQTLVSVAMGLALATVATATHAEGGGWYFGVTGGQAQVDISRDDLDSVVLAAFASAGAPVVSGASHLDDSDMSVSLFGGYRFTEYFALEAGYVDFGTAKYRASGVIDPIGLPPRQAEFSTDFETKGFTMAAVGAVPLNHGFDLQGRLGVLFADTEISVAAGDNTGSASDSLSADSQDLFYGIGLGLHLGPQWSFCLEWQQFEQVGDEDETGETDIDRVSLGVIFKL